MTFPTLRIPLSIPYPPMEAKRREAIPSGDGWIFEPKWDGVRAIVFRHANQVVIQSKSGQPLARYFPEVSEDRGLRRGRIPSRERQLEANRLTPSRAVRRGRAAEFRAPTKKAKTCTMDQVLPEGKSARIKWPM
ncbi:MAG TPA: hypothetical protein VIL97_12140 [Thermoanaerobaculia bacterium]